MLYFIGQRRKVKARKVGQRMGWSDLRMGEGTGLDLIAYISIFGSYKWAPQFPENLHV